jgi:hypothetical protein
MLLIFPISQQGQVMAPDPNVMEIYMRTNLQRKMLLRNANSALETLG